jgi:hypothetical protein
VRQERYTAPNNALRGADEPSAFHSTTTRRITMKETTKVYPTREERLQATTEVILFSLMKHAETRGQAVLLIAGEKSIFSITFSFKELQEEYQRRQRLIESMMEVQ